MDEQPDSNQQLMDILLVMDEKGTLQAVSGVKDGELRDSLKENGIGTPATRASIIETLFARDYVRREKNKPFIVKSKSFEKFD